MKKKTAKSLYNLFPINAAFVNPKENVPSNIDAVRK